MTTHVWIDAGAERDPDPEPRFGTIEGFVLRSTVEDALLEGDREKEARQARARRAKKKAASERAKRAWANRYVQA